MKTIGVLGGLGPQATMDFEARVHQVAQRLIPQSVNSGYPPLVVFYYRFSPAVASNSGASGQLRADPCLLGVAAKVGGLADFLVITSNFLHLFEQEIAEAAECEVLSMVDLTLAQVQERGWQRVGVLGFGNPIVYTQPLQKTSTVTETISGGLQAKLDNAIHQVMEGRQDTTSIQAARDALSDLRARLPDGIILGCTEIPLLLGDEANAPDLLNPLQLLAEAAVAKSLT